MASEFLANLEKGVFVVPVCMSCLKKAWPPSARCPSCLSKTRFTKVATIGTLVEFAASHVKDREGVFGIVEMDGFRLVGSIGGANLKEGMEVGMSKCGIGPDGTPYYHFQPAE
ncbi:MAG: Zn-ribbon domain-containing OB-fold protein [Nitrososphaera sp.]